MAGWASGFEIGARSARGLIDTYRTSSRLNEIDKVMNEKPTEGYGFNKAEVDQVQAAVDSGQYDVGFDAERKAYTVAPKADPTQVGIVGQGELTRFLGKEQVGRMTPEQLDRARSLALSDIEMKTDPAAGLRMRREIAQQDRDAKRFGWEEQAQPLKQRGLELAASAGERVERQGVRSDDVLQIDDEIAKMPKEALEIYASRLNSNDSQFPMLYTGQTKDGFKFVTTDPANGKPTGKEITLNEAQLRQMAAASVLGMAGYGQESMVRLSGVNKEIADHIKMWNDTLTKTTGSENAAVHMGNQDRIAQQNANTNEAYRRQIAAAAGARAAGGSGGPKGADAMWNLAEQVAAKGHYGGNPERAYEGLKRGQVRGGVQEQAQKLEIKLRENMAPESEIQKQVAGLLLSNGLPPPAAIANLRAGKGPDGKPLTANDYAQWDQTFPAMLVEDILGSVPEPAAQPTKQGLPDRAPGSARAPRTPITTLVQPRTAAEARAQINPPVQPRLTDEELAIRAMGLKLPR